MNGTFNVLGSAYGVDPVSYNQRQHEERRKREGLDARVMRFLGRELYGKSFKSLEALPIPPTISVASCERERSRTCAPSPV